MSRWRKKPVVIEAEQFTDQTKDRVFHWAREIQFNIAPSWDESGNPMIFIPTLEGEMKASLDGILTAWYNILVNRGITPARPLLSAGERLPVA